MVNYCVISHTHWDREWYLPLENFRMRLVDLIDNLLDILDKDNQYRFHLDAQTIVLEDYLAIRPHRRSILEKHIREGRILVGPWYVQNDFYLTSGEATVRNLIIGTAIAEEFGGCMPVGYAADQFGLISQLPQILNRFGLDTCVFGRGFSKPEATPLEFYWTSEDGSKVLCEHMAYWYNNAQRFSDDVNGTRNLLQNRYEIMKDRVRTSNYLLMNGVDHLEAQEDLSAIIGAVRPTLPEGQRFFQDTLPEFLSRVKAELAENGTVLEEHGGEFRHGGSDSVLTGTLSSRIDLKLANADCQAQMEHLLEPLCVFCSDLGVKEYPADYMRYLWKLLIENHPHDSICGCSADAVHRHMHDRFARIRENVTDLVSRYAGALLNHVQREGRDASQFLILVMNTLQQAWDKPITVTLEIPVEEDKGAFVITNAKGETVPHVIRSVSLDRGKRILSPINLPGEREVNVYEIVLDAIGVAGMSYEALTVTLTEGDRAVVACAETPANVLENDFLRAEIRSNGTVDLLHKESGVTYRGLFLLEDNADHGDSYIYVENDGSEIVTSEALVCDVAVVEENAYASRRLVTCELPVERGGVKRSLPISMLLSLEKGSKTLDCELTVTNTAEDHRLRIHFPTGMQAKENYAGAPYDCVKRPQTSPYPRDAQQPNTGYVGLEEDGRGVAILNSGLYEYEQTEDGVLALTLLRAVGRITGNWEQRDRQMETWRTKDSQMQGQFTYRLAVYPYEGDAVAAGVAQRAVQLAMPILAISAPVDYNKWIGGRPFVQIAGMPDLFYRPLENAEVEAPLGMSLFEVLPSLPNGVVITAVKGSEDGRGMVVRGYNVTSEAISVTLKSRKRYAHIDRLTMGEKYLASMALDGQEVSFSLAPKEIFTIGLFS